MSSRALRRLQKQRAEQIAQEHAAEEHSDGEAQPVRFKQSAFALLNETGDDENADRVEAGDPVEEDTAIPIASQEPAEAELPQGKPSKKKKKKRKSKAAGADATQDAEEDDIDALLASVAQSQSSKSGVDTSAGQNGSNDDQLERLLAVDTQHLHAINEMRRLFGREAIDDRPRQPQQAPRRHGQRVQQEGRGFPAVSLKRNIFVQGKESWPRATTGGLGMEVVNKDVRSGVTEYRFVHSTAYQDTQRQYEIAVASMDPQRLVVLLQHNPYHIATWVFNDRPQHQDN
jgi:hypothetical protein